MFARRWHHLAPGKWCLFGFKLDTEETVVIVYDLYVGYVTCIYIDVSYVLGKHISFYVSVFCVRLCVCVCCIFWTTRGTLWHWSVSVCRLWPVYCHHFVVVRRKPTGDPIITNAWRCSHFLFVLFFLRLGSVFVIFLIVESLRTLRSSCAHIHAILLLLLVKHFIRLHVNIKAMLIFK